MKTDHRAIASTSPPIAFRGVVVEYPAPNGGFKRVLDGIDLTIGAGEFVALVGKTGCGKTTLLNMIAGLVDPVSGTVAVGDDAPRSARGRLGFMLARDALLPWRSAIRNVEYGLELRGIGKRQRREVASRWLRSVHLEHAEKLWPWQLSQGMRQRVALARTWALDPEILLMDEPFAALDVNTRLALQQEFLRLWQSGETGEDSNERGSRGRKTVVFVTHDLQEAIALADRIVLLGDGRVLHDEQVGIERPRALHDLGLDARFQELSNTLKSLI